VRRGLSHERMPVQIRCIGLNNGIDETGTSCRAQPVCIYVMFHPMMPYGELPTRAVFRWLNCVITSSSHRVPATPAPVCAAGEGGASGQGPPRELARRGRLVGQLPRDYCAGARHRRRAAALDPAGQSSVPPAFPSRLYPRCQVINCTMHLPRPCVAHGCSVLPLTLHSASWQGLILVATC